MTVNGSRLSVIVPSFVVAGVTVAYVTVALLSAVLHVGVGTGGSGVGVLPACVSEDSDNCVWDATVQGNGEGRSYEVRDGVVTYTD